MSTTVTSDNECDANNLNGVGGGDGDGGGGGGGGGGVGIAAANNADLLRNRALARGRAIKRINTLL
jgi:hypothetical protein